jgi:hypothetical protein
MERRYFLIGGRALFPLIPYNGFLRPLLPLFATGTTLALLAADVSEVLLSHRSLGRSAWDTSSCCSMPRFFPNPRRTCGLVPAGAVRQLKGALEMAEGTGRRLLAPQAVEGFFLHLSLCVPVGYLLPRAFLQRGKQLRFWQVICAGAAVSAIIELTQFVTCLGMLELDDWLLNAMGTSLGYLLCRKLFPLDMR